MTAKIQSQMPFESLVDAIASLALAEKRQLQEVLEQQIFEQEESSHEDNLETIAEIQAVRSEYTANQYQTIDEFLAHRTKSIS
jgi:hypothetical protein